jgi:uncharacterized repeat protein (TIGR03843 family)
MAMSDERPALGMNEILALLTYGELIPQTSMPWSSNATILCIAAHEGNQALAIYKPQRGERPLWDFTRGTLCQREAAAFVMSQELKWHLVPPTVLRDGPYGLGSVQLFIENDEEAHLFTMQQEGGFESYLPRLAVFDAVINNADRKSGHCLKGNDGRLWAIDHGVSFHHENKLRTVLWDFAGEAIPDEIMQELATLRGRIHRREQSLSLLDTLLSPEEIQALQRRIERLLAKGKYPQPSSERSYPWPPV